MNGQKMIQVDQSLNHWKQLLVYGQDVLKSQQDIPHAIIMITFCLDPSQSSVSFDTVSGLFSSFEWSKSFWSKSHMTKFWFWESQDQDIKIQIKLHNQRSTTNCWSIILNDSFWILVVARLFCVLSLILGTIGAVIFLTGMSCTQLGSTPGAKKKMRFTSGIMEAFGGVLIRK